MQCCATQAFIFFFLGGGKVSNKMAQTGKKLSAKEGGERNGEMKIECKERFCYQIRSEGNR